MGVLAAMLHEMGCDEANVTKVIRLGKRMTGTSSEVKTRPIKMVVESEEQKVKILRSAKKLGGYYRREVGRMFLYIRI